MCHVLTQAIENDDGNFLTCRAIKTTKNELAVHALQNAKVF